VDRDSLEDGLARGASSLSFEGTGDCGGKSILST